MMNCAQTTAAQPPVFDALDAVSLRTWFNAPYCSTLEGDVFKAANVLNKFTKVRVRERVCACACVGMPQWRCLGACGCARLLPRMSPSKATRSCATSSVPCDAISHGMQDVA